MSSKQGSVDLKSKEVSTDHIFSSMLFLVNICYDNSRGIIQKRTAALIQYNLFLGESDSV